MAVPRLPQKYGAPGDAARLLREVGLVPEETPLPGPAYVVGLDPRSGTIVPLGSTVTIRLGDG